MLAFISNVSELSVDSSGGLFSRGDLTTLGLSQVSLPSVVSSVECQDGGQYFVPPKHFSFCESVLPKCCS